MKFEKGGKIKTFKCDKCGRVIISRKGINGLPNCIAFMKDGKIIEICEACMMELDRLREKNDTDDAKEFIESIKKGAEDAKEV